LGRIWRGKAEHWQAIAGVAGLGSINDLTRKASERDGALPFGMPKMNVGRGALRLWVVFAVLWAGLFGYLAHHVAQLDVGCHLGTETNCFPNPIEHLVGIAEFVVGVPVAVLIFGLALAWAFKGFKGSTERERIARTFGRP
jgi:hypothetical protein